MRLRTKAREVALQYLYQVDITKRHSEEILKAFIAHFVRSQNVIKYARELINGVFTNLEKIDELIDSASKNWPVRRMSKTDRNILRIATYELIFNPDTPYRVVINEGIELAKRFGTPKSSAFVNGVLDRIRIEGG
ncbi:MAG: transcription antitermination factor NusB [Thermodesulfobacteriota bacterium]|nr:transcription antitermination factor NusB [Thermodesulfobacteriota bacterium]